MPAGCLDCDGCETADFGVLEDQNTELKTLVDDEVQHQPL
jgi:hypothetical protein